MFFDVTRAGTDRTLRVAVAAIAYLDTLPTGSVLHLVGGQSLQVCQTAAEIEERAIAARPTAAIQCGNQRIEYVEPALDAGDGEPVDWTEVLGSGLAAAPAASATPPAPPAKPQARRRRQGKVQ